MCTVYCVNAHYTLHTNTTHLRYTVHTKKGHYYGPWYPPPFLWYLSAQFDYLHREFCNRGVNSVNMMILHYLHQLPHHLGVNGVNSAKGVNTIHIPFCDTPPTLRCKWCKRCK